MIIRFKGKVLQLITRRQRLSNGHWATIEIIRHPGAVVVIPLIKKDQVVLLKQFRPAIGIYLYELPAGTRHKNESPLACARREIIEETGFRAQRFTRLGKIYLVPGYSTEQITIFKAEGLTEAAVALKDAEEIIETHLASKTQIKKLFETGKIVDAKTICALVFLGWL